MICLCGRKLSSIRKTKIRFYEYYEDGLLTGIELLTARLCRKCNKKYFYSCIKLLDGSILEPPKPTTEDRFNSASDYVGQVRIGSTASEFTKRISRGPEDLVRRYSW